MFSVADVKQMMTQSQSNGTSEILGNGADAE